MEPAAGSAWTHDPRHVHTREAETFIVLDGALEWLGRPRGRSGIGYADWALMGVGVDGI